MRSLAVLLAVVLCGTLAVHTARAQTRAPASELAQELAAQLGPALVAALEVAARPLNVGEQTVALEAPIRSAEFDVHTVSVSTTAVSLTGSDVSTTDRGTSRAARFVQALRISNRSASQGVCYWVKDFATSCASACTTSPKTCSGASTDGDYIAPGAWLPVAVHGDQCVCGIAPAASTLTTIARVQRYPE